MDTLAVKDLTRMALLPYNGGTMGGDVLLWLHLLKMYCRSLKPINCINALFCWFAKTDFSGKSWKIFVEDLCTIANVMETAVWKRNLAKEGTIEAVHALLTRTILPFYLYLFNYKYDSFVDVWVSDMVAPEERVEFTEYLNSLSEMPCESKGGMV